MFSSGFYTPVGVFTVSGLHVLPAYLYFIQHVPDTWPEVSPTLLYIPLVVLVTGRTLALAVEVSSLPGGSGSVGMGDRYWVPHCLV